MPCRLSLSIGANPHTVAPSEATRRSWRVRGRLWPLRTRPFGVPPQRSAPAAELLRCCRRVHQADSGRKRDP